MTAKNRVAASFRDAPVCGVVRTDSHDAAGRIARSFIDAGLELIEITFTVPEATRLVAELLEQRGGDGPPWIGMGTVTDGERVERALDAGAEFIISPNVARAVADAARQRETFLVMGALTPSEIVEAHELGADLVKVFPVPMVGGPAYIAVVRGPLDDIPLLASGGFGVEEIPAYREAGVVAYGIGGPLLGDGPGETTRRVARALALARGETGPGGDG